jgi:hypothetical protein
MTSSHMTRRFVLGFGLAASVAASGCELGVFDNLQERSTMVHVFATHHATAEDGSIPHRGDDGEYRVFETDDGWTVTLVKGYVVTAGITLHRCDGTEQALDLFRGTIIEDIRGRDLGLSTVGAAELSPGTLCAMTVHYAPFDEDGVTVDPEVDGTTVYLHGVAKRGEDEMVPFEISAQGTLDVELDLSTANDGRPVEVTGKEHFPIELTLSKTYDQFFDAIDFTDMAQLDMSEHVLAVLEGVTRVAPGTRVAPN